MSSTTDNKITVQKMAKHPVAKALMGTFLGIGAAAGIVGLVLASIAYVNIHSSSSSSLMNQAQLPPRVIQPPRQPAPVPVKTRRGNFDQYVSNNEKETEVGDFVGFGGEEDQQELADL